MITQPQSSNPQSLKLIFKGRLEFGNERSYNLMANHWTTRLENYFKADILFKAENVLVPEELALVLPQPHTTIQGASEKAWRGTVDLLREMVQFAVVGKLQAWCINNGRVTEVVLEPKSDKTAVSEYWAGCQHVDNDGMEEAAASLSRAIDKYQRHALAYERRGYVNYKLQNFNDALYDFSKSIDINPNNPEPHYGRGKVRMLKNEWEAAAQDFDATIKRSIALQPLFWLARLKKGECLVHSKQFVVAVTELQMFLKREFDQANPNYRRRRRAWHLLGKALLGVGDTNGALEAFNQSINTREGVELLPEAEALLHRGIARKQAGKSDFAVDLAAAAELGNKEAARLLSEWV